MHTITWLTNTKAFFSDELATQLAQLPLSVVVEGIWAAENDMSDFVKEINLLLERQEVPIQEVKELVKKLDFALQCQKAMTVHSLEVQEK